MVDDVMRNLPDRKSLQGAGSGGEYKATHDFPDQIVSLAICRGKSVPCCGQICWNTCLKPYLALWSNRRASETGMALHLWRRHAFLEFRKLTWLSLYKIDMNPSIADLRKVENVCDAFLRRAMRDAYMHPVQAVGVESRHHGLIASLELKFLICAAEWVALKARLRTRGDDPTVDHSMLSTDDISSHFVSLIRQFMIASSLKFSGLSTGERSCVGQPFMCVCIQDIWRALIELAKCVPDEFPSFDLDSIFVAALKHFLESPSPFLNDDENLTFAWWFFDSISEILFRPAAIYEQLNRKTLNEQNSPPEDELKVQLVHFLRCTDDSMTNISGRVFYAVSKSIKCQAPRGPLLDLAKYISKLPSDAEDWKSVVSRRLNNPSDVCRAQDTFEVFLHILAKYRNWKEFKNRMRVRLKFIPMEQLNELGWFRLFDLLLTLLIRSPDQVDVLKEFFSCVKKLEILRPTRPEVKSGAWKIVIRGLWSAMIIVKSCDNAVQILAEILVELCSSFVAVMEKKEAFLMRSACEALVEYYSGLSLFLKSCEMEPPLTSSSLLPKCPAKLFSKLARLTDFLPAVLSILRSIRSSSEIHLQKTPYSVEEQLLNKSLMAWISSIFQHVWEHTKSLAFVDEENMKITALPNRNISDILVETTLLEKHLENPRSAFVQIVEQDGLTARQVHPVVLCCYIVKLMEEDALRNVRETLLYAAWARCHLLMPKGHWGYDVDVAMKTMDQLISGYPMAMKVLRYVDQNLMQIDDDESQLFSCEVSSTVVQEFPFWKLLILGCVKAFKDGEDAELASLPEAFAGIQKCFGLFCDGLDKYFADGHKKDAFVNQAVEFCAFLVSEAVNLFTRGNEKYLNVVTGIINFIFLTRSARSVGTLLNRDLLDIARQHLPTVIMSICNEIMSSRCQSSLVRESLRGIVQQMFDLYLVRFSPDSDHPLYKVLVDFVGSLPLRILYQSVEKFYLSPMRNQRETEMCMRFVLMFARQEQCNFFSQESIQPVMLRLMETDWPNLTLHQEILRLFLRKGDRSVIVAILRRYVELNLALNSVKTKKLIELTLKECPQLMSEIQDLTFPMIEKAFAQRGNFNDPILL
ncbi:unnamed protein product [Notodromas monacha]|uniref:Methyl methanesulfonate-sensitivity protein 22-like n=1 Tax=Notodromas monacha TaxID=399045 RepID=A0A7R9BP03_9CRUS|nr:unnamed protein product [Notodromas monacha]CAG0917516.1 unnamed protein product [Notodromas monacha]